MDELNDIYDAMGAAVPCSEDPEDRFCEGYLAFCNGVERPNFPPTAVEGWDFARNEETNYVH